MAKHLTVASKVDVTLREAVYTDKADFIQRCISVRRGLGNPNSGGSGRFESDQISDTVDIGDILMVNDVAGSVARIEADGSGHATIFMTITSDDADDFFISNAPIYIT